VRFTGLLRVYHHTHSIAIGASRRNARKRATRILENEDAEPETTGSVRHMTTRPHDVLDPAVVSELQTLARAGDPHLLERLGASFARDAPRRLQALRTAVAAGDADTAMFAIHALRGSAATLGATEVAAMCRRIENAPAPIAADRIEPLIAELERTAIRAEAALFRLAAAGPGPG
jgi:HPt (histidine-containing phosphotransfer) domain-containing protein